MAIKSSNQITFTEHKKIVEIKEYYLATSKNEGITTSTSGWTTDIQTIDYTNKYLWNYEEVIYSIGSSDVSEPVIIGFYGKGDTGKGISNIVNYYQITQNLVAPELPTGSDMHGWSDQASTASNLSPTNKYLWNYEAIIYTDGSTTITDPAIIGVYGDSGADAITFEIYSSYGFMFKEDLQSIELKIAAFKGGEPISGATYKWEWWNDTLNSGAGGYSSITTEQSLTVSESEEYAFANLRCTMTYNGKTYFDYVTLTSETVIYTTVVKFFDGSNIFHADDLYLVAYLELYQNNHRVESALDDATSYCTGVSSVSSSGVITANISGSFTNGDKMYFIKKTDSLYTVVLGQYQSGVWNVVNHKTKYTYENTLYSSVKTNVIAISKESINKSQNVDFVVFRDGVNISTTNVNIIDSNDPIVSNNAPLNPVYNQLWLDTSITPPVLKIYTQNNLWVECSEKIGGSVFTSKPNAYSAGDLWILAIGETCNGFGAGSMLKAKTTSNTFNASHWDDADAKTTELKNNILQTFTFNPGNDASKGLSGLTVGQVDEKFYVNISSTEMGFYDNEHGQNQKVVKIGNNSATIQSAKLKGNTEFYGQMNICDPNSNPEDDVIDTLFVWKVEKNKSLSLAIAN